MFYILYNIGRFCLPSWYYKNKYKPDVLFKESYYAKGKSK